MVETARVGMGETARANTTGETDLYVLRELFSMSGKAKLVLVIALVAIVYVMMSSGGDPVEVTDDSE